jgi:DNA-binding LytR/AlgR family response regulator
MRCLAIEDEPLAAARLQAMVQQVPGLVWLGSVERAEQALQPLAASEVDLLFLDLGLQGLQGLDWLEVAAPACPVILTTADGSQALRAFDLRVCDYLHKPFTLARFIQAVERVRARQPRPAAPARDLGFFKVGGEWRRVTLAELLYIEGDRDYRCLHLQGGRQLLSPQTFGEFEAWGCPWPLCRIHRSYLVNLMAVETLGSDAVHVAGRKLPVAPGRREGLLQAMALPRTPPGPR